MVSLASLAGEKMFFDGDNSSGVSRRPRDTPRCIATFMEGYWGMGQTVASHGVTREAGIGGGRCATATAGEPGEPHAERQPRRAASRTSSIDLLERDPGAARGEPARGPRRRPRARAVQDDHRRGRPRHHRAGPRGRSSTAPATTPRSSWSWPRTTTARSSRPTRAAAPIHVEFPVLPGLAREPVDVVGAFADREAIGPGALTTPDTAGGAASGISWSRWSGPASIR